MSTGQVRELLSRLVQCPSVNPADRQAFENPFGEARLAELLAELMRSWGAAVQVMQVRPGRPNVLARFEGPAGSPTLMFEAHSDTVSAEGMTVPPFEALVRDGKLFGRGACDTKGSMAAMLLGIRRLLDEPGGLPVTVLFASTCGEELGAMGAKALVAAGLRADAVLVGEPTDLAVVHASKGVVRLSVQTRGRAAHSSDPALGTNAIYHMRRVLEAVETELAPALERRGHPQLGAPTICVGTIAGGTQANIVPDRCRVQIDRRTLPAERPADVVAELLAPLDRLRGQVSGFDYVARYEEQFPPLWTDPQAPLARLVCRACQDVLGRFELAGAAWASNAAVFAAAGMPAVLLGPGSIRQAHTAGEYVELEAVARAAEVYARVIRLFGAPEG